MITIELAGQEQAEEIREVMHQAFAQYNSEKPPSGAMLETASSIRTILAEETEKALLCFMNLEPAGMVRIREEKKSLYFSRLSVVPAFRGRGIGKALIKEVERYAIEMNKQMVTCKVRVSTPDNIKRYEAAGYHIYDTYELEKPGWPPIAIVAMKKILKS
ncbi:GNAT family N-acetyltransferase [Alteribacillus sp. HJP-4]|uniref:GNAT family N-acetyltransferase n=1 Tax=Alteribacillus sp. HJP-4 TaxID=2775394 RepID=UPI0035CCC881